MLLIIGFLFVILIFAFVNIFSHLHWTLFIDLPSFLLIFIPYLIFHFPVQSSSLPDHTFAFDMS